MPLSRRSHRVSLVCFPFAGGARSSFNSWKRLVEDRFGCFVLQYPGREDRIHEPFREDLGVMASELSDELRPIASASVLFGHSMGAIIMFAVAQTLMQSGIKPLGLIASGCEAPQLTRKPRLHRSAPSDDELVRTILSLDGTDDEVAQDPELMEFLLPRFRADFEIASSPPISDIPVDVPILSIGGSEDPAVGLDELRRWSRCTTCEHATVIFPGGHFYLNDQTSAVVDSIEGFLASL